MPETLAVPQRMRLSSCDYAGRDKADAVRELLGREVMRVDLWPCEGAVPLDLSATVMSLGDDCVYVRTEHTPMHIWRSPEMLRDGADDVYLGVSWSRSTVHTPHESIDLSNGRFGIISKARVHEYITPHGGCSAAILVPHSALAQQVPGLEEAPLRLLPPDMPEPALAMGYAQLLASMPGDPALSLPLLQSAQSHLLELMARMLAPAARSAQPPESDALHVPRLALIRRDILARIDQHELSLAQIARRHHLTPRQVQRLFAREGTCFSDFVRDARLDRVRAALADPRQRHRLVLQIVQDSGFDDFSAFSRAFKRRFGMTPTEVRNAG